MTAVPGQNQATIHSATSPVPWPPSSHSRRAVSAEIMSPNVLDRVERGYPRSPADLAAGPYRELDVSIDLQARTLWCFMQPQEIPSFTHTMLRELMSLRASVQRLFAHPGATDNPPIQYFVGGSRMPGIYNLGGDLGFFAACIRDGDRDALRLYAYDCIDVGYHLSVGLDVPVVTIGLVQGDALGGGFEGALSFNVLVAERRAKFGLPEILFNLFPGMGAFSFLSRKLDPARARRMVMSGQIYSAEELHELGLVDVLAENGQGEDAVRDYIARHTRQHAIHRSIFRASERVNPLSFEELREITDIWVDAAMQLNAADLRKMERLMNAQRRRLAATSGTVQAAR